jgi:riboflavin transporter FmnP
MKRRIQKMMPPTIPSFDPVRYPWKQYPIAFLDYLWVISIYVSLSFLLAVLVDNRLFPQFDERKEEKKGLPHIAGLILLQLATQGFIAIILAALLQLIPSPFNTLLGYHGRSSLGLLIRNPAIIYVMLFALSNSLRSRLLYLFDQVKKIYLR